MGVRSGSRAACGTKGAVARAPNHAFGIPNGVKTVQKRGPAANGLRRGLRGLPGPQKIKTTSFWEPFRVQNETPKRGVLSEAF